MNCLYDIPGNKMLKSTRLKFHNFQVCSRSSPPPALSLGKNKLFPYTVFKIFMTTAKQRAIPPVFALLILGSAL